MSQSIDFQTEHLSPVMIAASEHQAVKHPMLALLSLFAITFSFIMTELLPMGVLQVMGNDLQQSEARIGFLVSVFALAVVITSAPLAGFTARLPRRPLLLTLIAVLSLGNIVVAFSHNYVLDMLVRFLIGITNGVFWGMIGSLATRMVPAERRGRALSMVFAGNTAALTLGIPLSAAASLVIGWQATFASLGVLGLVLALLGWRLLPSLPGITASAHTPLIQVLRTPGVAAIALATLLSFTAHFALYTYITPYLRYAGVSVGAIAPVLFAFGIIGIAGVWLTGIAIERRPRVATVAILWLFLVTLLVLAFTAQYKVPAVAVIATVAWGFAWSTVPMLFQSAILHAVPKAPDPASAILFTSVNIAITTGSFIGGKTLESIGIAWIPVLACACMAGALVTVIVARRHAFPA